MRMGFNEFSAKEVINKLDGKSLIKIFKSFGDERDAKLIVKNIIKEITKVLRFSLFIFNKFIR